MGIRIQKQNCYQSLCICISLAQPIQHKRIKHVGQPTPTHTMHVHQAQASAEPPSHAMYCTSINVAGLALHVQTTFVQSKSCSLSCTACLIREMFTLAADLNNDLFQLAGSRK